MSLRIPASTRKLIPEGVHEAICYGVVDLGTQYNGRRGKSAHRVLICWELPEVRIKYEKDGEEKEGPSVISNQYTMSRHEKSFLRCALESWRGRRFTKDELEEFDFKNMLGVPCQIQILHNEGKDGRIYANVQNVMPSKRKNVTLENEPLYFSFEENEDIPEHTPAWIREKIENSLEYPHRLNSTEIPNGTITNDDKKSMTDEEGVKKIEKTFKVDASAKVKPKAKTTPTEGKNGETIINGKAVTGPDKPKDLPWNKNKEDKVPF